jgi:hypothetical protein
MRTGLDVDLDLWADCKRAAARSRQSLRDWAASAFRAALTRQAIEEEKRANEPKPAA